jgi:hypothetical protein
MSAKSVIRTIFGTIDWGLANVVLVWTGWAISMDPAKYPSLTGIITATRDHAPWILFSAVGLGLVARWARLATKEKTACDKRTDRLVGEELRKFRKICFPSVPDTEPLDNNRVTIFRRVSWCWRLSEWRATFWPWGYGRGPSSGWLVAAHRSGHATQLSTTVFLAPDDAPQAEGVAGLAWRGEGTHVVSGLPDLSNVRYGRRIWRFLLHVRLLIRWENERTKAFRADLDLVRQYAEATNVRPRLIWQRLQRLKQNPRFVLALPLQTPDNQPWGVLVVDSSNTISCIGSDSREFRSGLSKLKTQLARLDITRA